MSQQNPSQALVVIDEHVALADSRAIAKLLGIEHRSFFRQIVEYQAEIEEDFGKVRILIAPSGRTNQPQKYALLTEDQTYAYMSYSQNTDQARACKRMLVKAFRDAREQIKQLEDQHRQAPAPQINSLWQRRLETFYRENKLPAGYWCVFGMVAGYCWTDELRQVHLLENALPDGSIGSHWCKYLHA